MAVRDVSVVSVPVSDQDRAKAFYVEKLGFELTRDDDSVPGIHWIQVTPKRGATSLTLVTWFETMPAGSLQGLVLGSDELRRIARRSRPTGWSLIDRCSSSRGAGKPSSATQTGTGSYCSKPDRAKPASRDDGCGT